MLHITMPPSDNDAMEPKMTPGGGPCGADPSTGKTIHSHSGWASIAVTLLAVAVIAACTSNTNSSLAHSAKPTAASNQFLNSHESWGTGTTNLARSASSSPTPAPSGTPKSAYPAATTALQPEPIAGASRSSSTGNAPTGVSHSGTKPTRGHKAGPRSKPTSSVRTPSPRPPTTDVAPPIAGDINTTVPAREVVTLPAVGLTTPARPVAGVSVQVSQVVAVNTQVQFPGEIAGPGLSVTVHMVNSGTEPIDLNRVIVDLRRADGGRAIEVTGEPAAPLSGSLPAGGDATGVYVFTIPQDQRNPIKILVSFSAQVPTVLFAGDAR